MNIKIWAILLRYGFEPFANTNCDWRRKGTIDGEVERVWLTEAGGFRVYRAPDNNICGHGNSDWELEGLL